MEEVCKKGTDIMRFRHNEVNSEATFDDHQNTSNVHKICFGVIWMTFTCEVKTDLIMFETHYVRFLFMNLLHSPAI